MIYSMTGYGKSSAEFNNKRFIFEVKSLNSRQLDIKLRLPKHFYSKELEIRRFISEKLERGKIDFSMNIDQQGDAVEINLNKEVILKYHQEFKDLQKSFGDESFNDYLSVIMQMPDVLNGKGNEISDEEWSFVRDQLIYSLDELNGFRLEEGEILKQDIEKRIQIITEGLLSILPYESERVEKLRLKFSDELLKLNLDNGYDKNRFEQELIYYLEKLDITEEKVRLQQHCQYFLQTLNSKQSSGKKLGFIMQEILREVNTIGSKANHAEIQRIVVGMKDEVEKIKEQLFNIL